MNRATRLCPGRKPEVHGSGTAGIRGRGLRQRLADAGPQRAVATKRAAKPCSLISDDSQSVGRQRTARRYAFEAACPHRLALEGWRRRLLSASAPGRKARRPLPGFARSCCGGGPRRRCRAASSPLPGRAGRVTRLAGQRSRAHRSQTPYRPPGSGPNNGFPARCRHRPASRAEPAPGRGHWISPSPFPSRRDRPCRARAG